MKKVSLIVVFLLFIMSCVEPYSPTCDKPNLGDYSAPTVMTKYYDSNFGDVAVVLNTNISAKFCYGYISFESPATGSVKIIPISKESGKTILSGLAVDESSGIAFTGERTEKKLIGTDLKTGERKVSVLLSHEPLKIYIFEDLNWGVTKIEKAVVVLAKGGYIGIWNENSLLDGKNEVDWFYTGISYPGDLYRLEDNFYIIPYTSGTFIVLNTVEKTQQTFYIPYSSTSWYGTYIGWCNSADMLCMPVNSTKELLFFNTETEDWGGRIFIDGMLFQIIDSGDIKIFSYFSTPKIVVDVNGVKEVVYTPKSYANILLVGDYLFVSDFGNNKLFTKKVK